MQYCYVVIVVVVVVVAVVVVNVVVEVIRLTGLYLVMIVDGHL